MIKTFLLLLSYCCCSLLAYGQLESEAGPHNPAGNDTEAADTEDSRSAVPVAIFKATRLINGATVASLPDGVLDVRISHRFGRLSEGSKNFFGLDNATTRIGLAYGITRWLMVGIGHSAFNKENDGFLKIGIPGMQRRSSPIAISYLATVSDQTTPAPVLPPGDHWLFRYRLYYAHQLLIASKFGDRLSLQLMPALVHYNIVDSTKNSNNTFALGAGGKVRISKRLALTAEYYYRLNNADMLINGAATHNELSAGLEVESGGHVFQLLLTNSQGITERTFIGQTTDSWRKGDLHFGFNISRIFAIKQSRELKY
jgi:opacity protein-like surface antigen